MAMNFMIYGLGMLGFWICGFAIMFGGYYNGPVAIGWQPSLGQGLALLNVEHGITIGDIKWGFMGGAGFFLNPSGFATPLFCLFLFRLVFIVTTATIPPARITRPTSLTNFLISRLSVLPS